MESLRITKKHHRHLNNPFPLQPRTLPFLQGTLLLEPTSALLSTGVFPIGQDFQLTWSSKNGGCFSISHRSQPAKSIWSNVPGQAFVSAAVAETEVEESRGSFLVKDRKVHLLCDHQTVEGISKIYNLQSLFQADEHDFPSGFLELEQNDVKDMKFPVLGISGRIFSKNKKRLRHFSTRMSGHIQVKEASISAELIEQFTENIGRPPELPEWIISGAVIGMQGGTDKVYNVWNELKAYDIPVSAFWLQVPGLWISQEAAQKGLPVCRHMFLHYPDDETVQGFTYQQFLVGTEILVVPVLDKGKNTVKAYFPKGQSCPWKHIWTGNLYANQEAWVEAPIGYPAVFVKVVSTVGETFLKNHLMS